jgi:GntR family histidine utilization transcriptional repressor
MAKHARPQPASAGTGSRARYLSVKDHVRAGIRSGRWKAGQRVPSEHELVAAMGISRMTVNRALREMADAGELVRIAGVGTFVGAEKPQSGLLRVANIEDEIRARGHKYDCDVIRVAREAATLEVAAALELKTGDAVFHSVCVHRENGVAVQLEDRFVNPRVVPGFIGQDFRRVRPSEYLLNVVPLDEVEHVVDAVRPTKEEARLLQIRPKEPCLVLTRRTWSDGRLVTFVRCVHPGSRYRLVLRGQTLNCEVLVCMAGWYSQFKV